MRASRDIKPDTELWLQFRAVKTTKAATTTPMNEDVYNESEEDEEEEEHDEDEEMNGGVVIADGSYDDIHQDDIELPESLNLK